MKSSTPGRLACVDLPAFPLQLLLRRHPEWRGYPAAVVAEDKPQGLILWVNEKARRLGALPGLRYAAAFSLAAELRAGEVSPAESKKAVVELARDLMRFTPEVEPSKEEPGVFWLNGAGLERLYASEQKWAYTIYKDLRAQGFTVNLTAGFTRFGAYAVAKTNEGVTVLRDPTEERHAARAVPLNRLNIEPEFRDALFKLGIKTVGGLLSLPPGGLRERFGKEAHRLYRMAAGDLWSPLDPQAPDEPVVQKCILDDPEDDTTRLLFLIKQLLHPLLATLARRHQALVALWLSLLIDKPYQNLPSALRRGSGRTAQPSNHDIIFPVRGELSRTMNGSTTQPANPNGQLKEPLRPAAPTLDAAQILDLVRLRLESLQLAAGVIEIELHAEACAATSEQLRLFTEQTTRDLDAANRALARLRAEFGDESVVCAKLTDGHLPEAKFTWEPLTCVKLRKNISNPSTELRAGSAEPLNDWNGWNDWNSWNSQNVLIRRITAKPERLDGGPFRSHEDGWLLGTPYGAIDKLTGPYVFSGGWWNKEIQREYYYAETRRGDLLWLYYDRVRRRWFLQGTIE